MGKPNSAMGRSRDLGIPGESGKGDKSRVTNQSVYAANFSEINWGPPEDKTKLNPDWQNSHPFIENDGEWEHIPDELCSRTIPPTKEFKSAPFLDVVAPTSDIIRE